MAMYPTTTKSDPKNRGARHSAFKPHDLVHVTLPPFEGGARRYVGEVMSYELPEGTIMVRTAPGYPGTLVELPVTHLDLCSWRHAYVIVAEVSGRGAFPVDMLRYDDCVPLNFELVSDGYSERAVLIPGLGDKLLVARCVEFASGQGFTAARWDSFLWSVKAVNVETIR